MKKIYKIALILIVMILVTGCGLRKKNNDIIQIKNTIDNPIVLKKKVKRITCTRTDKDDKGTIIVNTTLFITLDEKDYPTDFYGNYEAVISMDYYNKFVNKEETMKLLEAEIKKEVENDFKDFNIDIKTTISGNTIIIALTSNDYSVLADLGSAKEIMDFFEDDETHCEMQTIEL